MNKMTLLERYKAGDKDAVNEVLKMLYSEVHELATKITASETDGIEISKQVFNNAYQLRENFRTFRDLRAFVLVTARNYAYEYVQYQFLQQNKGLGNNLN